MALKVSRGEGRYLQNNYSVFVMLALLVDESVWQVIKCYLVFCLEPDGTTTANYFLCQKSHFDWQHNPYPLKIHCALCFNIDS